MVTSTSQQLPHNQSLAMISVTEIILLVGSILGASLAEPFYFVGPGGHSFEDHGLRKIPFESDTWAFNEGPRNQQRSGGISSTSGSSEERLNNEQDIQGRGQSQIVGPPSTINQGQALEGGIRGQDQRNGPLFSANQHQPLGRGLQEENKRNTELSGVNQNQPIGRGIQRKKCGAPSGANRRQPLGKQFQEQNERDGATSSANQRRPLGRGLRDQNMADGELSGANQRQSLRRKFPEQNERDGASSAANQRWPLESSENKTREKEDPLMQTNKN